MKSLDVFAKVRLDEDRYCVIYNTEDGANYLPVILYGDQAEMAESHFSDSMEPCYEQAIVFSKSAIEGVGATILYGELYYDSVHEGVCGRIACRQQNEVNRIFSLIDAPPAYVMALGVGVLTDDETLAHVGFDNLADAADMIGFNVESMQGEENGKKAKN